MLKHGNVSLSAVCLGLMTLSASSIVSAQSNSVRIDDSALLVRLQTRKTTNSSNPSQNISKYAFKVTARVLGSNLGSADALRVDWKQGNRVLHSERCALQVDPSNYPGIGWVSDCGPSEANLQATGNIVATITYISGADDHQTALRTMNLKVGRYWDWLGSFRNRQLHLPEYQIIADDLLGSSIVSLVAPASGETAGDVVFQFWASTRESWSNRIESEATFRCSVNGQPTSSDLNQRTETVHHLVDGVRASDRQFVGRAATPTLNYEWQRYSVRPMLIHGSPNNSGGNTDSRYNLSAHPGSWVCSVNLDGAPIREFRFTVQADGTITQHAEQQGPNGLSFPTGTTLLDTRFPRPNGFDMTFQPAAIRATGFFGRPWSNTSSLSEMFGALPPAVGRSEPAAPRR